SDDDSDDGDSSDDDSDDGTTGETTVTGENWEATLTESGDGLQVEFDHDSDSTWVDIHYVVEDGAQQNVRMESQDGSHTYTISDVSAGDTIEFWFTYEEDGLAIESGSHNITTEGN
ncbi:MAG: hypothetical protein ACOCR6_02985, partial [archaeon]